MGIFTLYCGQEFRTVLDLEDKINEAHIKAGLTLIGTCGDCKWYGDFQGQSVCTLIIPGHWFVSEREIPEDFGCNQWKGKLDV